MRKPEQFTAVQVADALRKARGIKAVAARALGCSRVTVEAYCKRYPTVQAVVEEQRELLVDVAESHLTKWVDAGNERAVFWTLGTLGKDRGYVPREEHTGKDGEPLQVEVIDARERLKAKLTEVRLRQLPPPAANADEGEGERNAGAA